MQKDEKKQALKRFLFIEAISDDKDEYSDSLMAVCKAYSMFPHEVREVFEALPEEFDDLESDVQLDELDKRLVKHKEEVLNKMTELVGALMRAGGQLD